MRIRLRFTFLLAVTTTLIKNVRSKDMRDVINFVFRRYRESNLPNCISNSRQTLKLIATKKLRNAQTFLERSEHQIVQCAFLPSEARNHYGTFFGHGWEQKKDRVVFVHF